MPPLQKRHDPFWIFETQASSSSSSLKKSVSFASHTQEFPVLNRENYSPLETQNTWYAKPDFANFSLDIRRTIKFIEGGGLVDDVNFTKRGSICREEGTARKRKQFRDAAKVCVLRAQDESQRNAEYISYAYIQYSRPSLQEALVQANQDHMEAKLVYSLPPPPVPDLLDDYFSDAWITKSADGSPLNTTSQYKEPPNLLTDDFDCFVETEPAGFDESWLLGPVVALEPFTAALLHI